MAPLLRLPVRPSLSVPVGGHGAMYGVQDTSVDTQVGERRKHRNRLSETSTDAQLSALEAVEAVVPTTDPLTGAPTQPRRPRPKVASRYEEVPRALRTPYSGGPLAKRLNGLGPKTPVGRPEPSFIPAPYSLDPSLNSSPAAIRESAEMTREAEVVAHAQGRPGQLAPPRVVEKRIVGPKMTKRQRQVAAARVKREAGWDQDWWKTANNEKLPPHRRVLFGGVARNQTPASALRRDASVSSSRQPTGQSSQTSVTTSRASSVGPARQSAAKALGRSALHSEEVTQQGGIRKKLTKKQRRMRRREQAWENRFHAGITNEARPRQLREYFDAPRSFDSATVPRTVSRSLNLHPGDSIQVPVSPIHKIRQAARLRDDGPLSARSHAEAEKLMRSKEPSDRPLSSRGPGGPSGELIHTLRLRQKTRMSPRAKRGVQGWDSRWASGPGPLSQKGEQKEMRHLRVRGGRVQTPGGQTVALQRVDSALSRGDFEAIADLDPALIDGDDISVESSSLADDSSTVMTATGSMRSLGEAVPETVLEEDEDFSRSGHSADGDSDHGDPDDAHDQVQVDGVRDGDDSYSSDGFRDSDKPADESPLKPSATAEAAPDADGAEDDYSSDDYEADP